MSLSFSLSIRDEVTPLLRSLPSALGGDGIKLAIGRAAARLIQANFAALQSQRPNRHGWPRQGYWAQAARSVSQPKPDPDGVTISVAQPGIAARYFGPTEIKPVAARYLTIPAREEAYGTRPIDSRWNGQLRFIPTRCGGMLVQRDMTTIRVIKDTRRGREGQQRVRRGEQAGGGVLFWLLRSVTMPQDKTVLPDADDLRAAAVMAAQDYLDAAIAKGGNR